MFLKIGSLDTMVSQSVFQAGNSSQNCFCRIASLDEGERPLLLAEALLGEGGEPAVDEELLPLLLVAQDAGHHSRGDVGLGAGSQLRICTGLGKSVGPKAPKLRELPPPAARESLGTTL